MSSFGATEVSEISRNLSGTRDVRVLSPLDLSRLRLVMVSRDHSTLGPSAAFFKESIRRVAITGTKIVFAL